MIDLSTVPDEDLKNEYMRRFNARYRGPGGRKPSLRPCPLCHEQFGSHALRAHLPKCKQNVIANVMEFIPSTKKARRA